MHEVRPNLPMRKIQALGTKSAFEWLIASRAVPAILTSRHISSSADHDTTILSYNKAKSIVIHDD